MQTAQQFPQDAPSPANGHTARHDLFALTDEQILEIEPEALEEVASGGLRVPSQQTIHNAEGLSATGEKAPQVAPASLPAGSASAAQDANRRLEAGATSPAPTAVASEPPPWLAAQMT